MFKKTARLIGLDELDLTNDDLFIRKKITNLDVDSKVIVDETHVAILLKNGIALETLAPGIYPIFDRKLGLLKNEKIGTFRVELFYISKTSKVRIIWGTPTLFDIHDPISDIAAKMGASGEIEIRIKNPRQFYLEVVGANKTFTVDDLKDRIKGRLLGIMEPSIASCIENKRISIDRISENKLIISDALENAIGKVLEREYGLEVASFIINNTNIPEKYIDLVNVSKKVNAKPVCPRCGMEVIPGSKFCNNCGSRIM